jgi:hypothetical protein
MFEPCGLAPADRDAVRDGAGGAGGRRYGRHGVRPGLFGALAAERNGYVFHHADNLAIESALSRILGQRFGCPAEFRQLAVNSMRAGYSWAWPGREYLSICDCIRRT